MRAARQGRGHPGRARALKEGMIPRFSRAQRGRETMKRMHVLCFALLLFCSCVKDPEKAHLGAWESETPGGEKLTGVFRKATFQAGFEDVEINGSYEIDYSKKPIWLDITTEDEKSRCILEFTGADTFRIAGVLEDAGSRPSTFEDAEEVYIFKRK